MSLYGRLRRIERWTAGVWLAIVAVAHSDAGVAFNLWMMLVLAMCALTGWWLVRTVLSLLMSRVEPESWRSRLWVPVAVALGVLLAATDAPLRLRLSLSDGALRAGGPALSGWHPRSFGDSRRVGLFFVREYSEFGREMRFLTSSCGLVDQCGVVYSPDGRPPNRGEDSFTHLYGSWWHWHQSW
jgi:hypothetical protein